MKQVIVIRKDLKMRRGKEIAQGAHASLMAVLDRLDHPNVQDWLTNDFTKITVRVESEAELLSVYKGAESKGLICSLVQDRGFTEFDGIPTYTAVAVGPDTDENLRPLTGHLSLY
ncbi:MAG: aminoacyl-tRNA hydrolase [Spongiibacteraceae bacterium]|nr:aminoacyl-tRNA hydrolase [Spongiibacteraceae bacterium]